MKRFAPIFLTSLLMLQTAVGMEFTYQSQPFDSTIEHTFTWQPGNRCRQLIKLDGEWNYRLPQQAEVKKIVLPAEINYEGEVTFQRFFEVDSSLADRFFRLVCYGINYYCEIFINNKFIGSHAGGYSSFFIDLSKEHLFFNQSNSIEIKVDTRLDSKKTIPLRFSPEGVKETFGIFRSIFLLALPELSLDILNFTPNLNIDFSRCDIDLSFELIDHRNNFLQLGGRQNAGQKLAYSLEIIDQEQNSRLLSLTENMSYFNYQPSTKITQALSLKKPDLWSPEQPKLYLLKIKLLDNGRIIDQLEYKFGIRQLDFFDGKIFLNGNSIFIKGVNWAEDYGRQSALFDRRQLLRDLRLIKQLNANAIRVLNFPAHPYLAHACDSLGLFLLQELPLKSVPHTPVKSDIYAARVADYLIELINRDRLHVSVFALGLGGDFLPNDTATRLFFEKIYQDIISKQPLAFYHYCSAPLKKGISIPGTIAAISLFDQGRIQIQQTLSAFVPANLKRINLVIAFGAPESSTSDKTEDEVLSQKYQVLKIAQAWETITRFSAINGCFISSLNDYFGNYPSTLYGNFSDATLRPVGLTDYQREPRYAFKAVQSLYQDGKCRYNPGIETKLTNPNIFVIVGLSFLLFFLFLYNSRRYFRENLKRIFVHPHGFYTDLRDGRKIPISHTILIGLFISVGCGLTLASLIFYFKSQPQLDHLLTLLLPAHQWKSTFSAWVWRPEKLILLLSGLVIIYFVLFAILIRIMALIALKKSTLRQTLTLSCWLGGNYLVLLPVGMILYRLLLYRNLFLFVLLFLLLLNLWYFFRIIKGLRVVFIWHYTRALITLLIILATIFAGVLYYYQSNYGLGDYLLYYYSIFKHQLFWPIF